MSGSQFVPILAPDRRSYFGRARAWRNSLVFLGSIALAAIVRVPFLSHIGADEAYYLVLGREWLHGSLPYVNSFDVKPPGLFALTAISEALFGETLLATKALAAMGAGTAAFALYLLGRRLSDGLSGLIASALYIALSLTLSRTNPVAELFSAPFVTLGVLMALDDSGSVRISHIFVAGLLFGAGASIKQTAAFEAASILAILLIRAPRGDRLRAATAFLAGCAVIPICFAALYLVSGHLATLIQDTVVFAARRANAENTSWSTVQLEFLSALIDFLPAALFAAMFWLSQGQRPGLIALRSMPVLAAWTIGALIGVAAGGGALYFYYLPLLPPLCLTGGLFVAAVQRRAASLRWQLGYGLLTAGGTILYTWWILAGISFPKQESLQEAIMAAAIIRTAHSPDSTMLATDAGLYVYLLAGAQPPTAVFHPRQLFCDLDSPLVENALQHALNAKPSFIVTANPPLIRNCEHPERRAALRKWLTDYCPLTAAIARTDGENPALRVYVLKKGQGQFCP